MKVSLIAPTSLIKEYGNKGSFHLTLAHLLDEKPNEYEKEIKKSGLPTYLDNGLFENGESVPLEDLMEKATRLKAEYVFAPDVLFNREATEDNILFAFDELKKANERNKSETKLAAVVQADNRDDYMASYIKMSTDPRISLIGLSILSIPKSYEETLGVFNVSESRLLCLSELNRLPHHKDSHLLGAGSSYVDVAYAARNCPWVKSHDSSSAIWNGVQGHIIQDDGTVAMGKTKVHVDFDFKKPLTTNQKMLICQNIENVLKLAMCS